MEQSNLIKLISNYGSKLWSFFSVFIFIPLYIKYLGVESYGLIGFYALLLGIISFADSGISSAIVKELSKKSSANYKYSVFRSLENIYLIICLMIFVILVLGSNSITDYWITSKVIPKVELLRIMYLIAAGISLQLSTSLYYGALFSLDNQVKSNLFQFIWSFAKSALVFVLFFLISKSIELYFIWQIICNAIYIVFLRINIVKKLKFLNNNKHLMLEFKKLPSTVLLYLKGMILIAIISSLNIQADKIITSSMFNLQVFGFYNLASSLGQTPLILATPLISFAFPLFSKFSDLTIEHNFVKNLEVFNKVFYLINIMISAVAFTVVFYTAEILHLWTNNSIPQNIFPAIVFDIRVLVIGTFFLALQFPLFYLLLSQGKTKYSVIQGVVQLAIGMPILYFCTKYFGLYGVPIPWLIINLLSFIALFIIVSKKYLKFASVKFYKHILAIPILVIAITDFLFYFLFSNTTIHFIYFALISSVLGITLSIIIFNKENNNPLLSFKHLYNFPV